MKKALLFTVVTSLLFPFLGWSQNTEETPWTEQGVKKLIEKSSELQLVKTCSMLSSEGYFYYASLITDRLLELNPSNTNYHYRKGFFLLEIDRDYNRALPYLLQASKKINQKADMFSTREQAAPTDILYHIGQCYHYQENLDSAKYYYESFLQKSNKKSELVPKVEIRLLQLETAKALIKNPVNITLRTMNGKISSPYPDYSSVISFDGSALYFTSRRPWFNNETDEYRDHKTNQYPEDVYVSYLDFDSTWTEPIRLLFCKPEINEATIAVSVDERRIYVYEDVDGFGDIYFSDFKNNRFKDVKHLDNSEINSQYWEAHCMVSQDGQKLFFSSDRPGGYGGLDIYYCNRKEDGTWGPAINIGPEINGPLNDDSPFVSITGDQLYFATNDSRSMGGYDILLSQLDENGNWLTPKNIGYPFNRTNDDLYYTTTVDGLQGYLTSYREEGNGEKDIYSVQNNFLIISPITIVSGEINLLVGDLSNRDVDLAIRINCLDCTPKNNGRLVYPRLRDGVFMSGLYACKTYKLEYIDLKDNKIIQVDTIKTSCNSELDKISISKLLDPDKRIFVTEPAPLTANDTNKIPEVVIKNEVISFINYFDYNKNKLNVSDKGLRKMLQKVEVRLKEDRSQVTLLIHSSSSMVPTSSFHSNKDLARLRAENLKYEIMNYFQKTAYTNQVVVVIEKTSVNGPEYQKDAKDTKKYKPYQYVSVQVE